MDYNNRPADDKIAEYLETTGRTARPSGSHGRRALASPTSPVDASVWRKLKSSGVREGGYVIGHDIPGMDSPVILNSDPDHLLNIVEEVAPQ